MLANHRGSEKLGEKLGGKSEQKFGRNKKIYTGLMLALLLSLLSPIVQPQAAYAQEEEIGYLWSLYWDFSSGYDAVLTIEVGPWKNGDLVDVTESSTATVRCRPSGTVNLFAGTAVFQDGTLNCSMNLREIVKNNHDLVIEEVDNYGSIFAQTNLKTSSLTVAPIFTHQDASYSIDFTTMSLAKLRQELWNDAGLLQMDIPTNALNQWHTYGYLYHCDPDNGPCEASFAVDGPAQHLPTAGSRTQFNTGPMSFQVGGVGLNGQMDWLLIDPGNSAH